MRVHDFMHEVEVIFLLVVLHLQYNKHADFVVSLHFFLQVQFNVKLAGYSLSAQENLGKKTVQELLESSCRKICVEKLCP